MRTTLANLLETLKTASRKFGPYLLLEVLLPGGTLLALALFLYRRQAGVGDLASQALATGATLFARVRAKLATRSLSSDRVEPPLNAGDARPNGRVRSQVGALTLVRRARKHRCRSRSSTVARLPVSARRA